MSPEERREAEARRAAEAERRRQQEAEIKQRAEEEERRRKAEAKERRRDEEERRRQETEDKRRLDEAEKEKRRQDEERLRLEAQSAAKALALAETRQQDEDEHRRQEIQQAEVASPPVKPWLLPAHWRSCCRPTDPTDAYLRPRSVRPRSRMANCCPYPVCSVRRCRGNSHTALQHSASPGHSGHSYPFITHLRWCTAASRFARNVLCTGCHVRLVGILVAFRVGS